MQYPKGKVWNTFAVPEKQRAFRTSYLVFTGGFTGVTLFSSDQPAIGLLLIFVILTFTAGSTGN